MHLVSATGTPIGETLGTLTAVEDSDTTGTGVGGHLTWTYTVANSVVAYLAAGETKVESFTITLDDQHGGVITRQIDVTITGSNDTASISGTAAGAVKEDGTLTAAGTLTVADVDSGEAHFQTPASLTATYGVFTFDPSTGVWGYTLNNAAANVQSLTGGQVVHDTLTVKSADGTASQQIDVTITGSNDTASISGTAAGAVKEDGMLTAAGTLTVADVDSGEAHFQTPASLTATYGVFTFDPSTGVWGYTLNNAAANVQSLAGGQVVHDTLTVKSADGTASQQIDVTITGTNEAAVITGTATGAVKEDGTLTAAGTLTVADVDSGEAHFQTPASLTATYGVFTFDPSTGVWGYTLNNAAANVQSLTGGQVVHDTLTVKSADGTASQQIDVTITGTNEAAVISGTAAGAVKEDGTLTAAGTLTVADVDSGEAHFQTPASLTATYGVFTFDPSTGVWGYTLNNAAANVQSLTGGQVVHDTLTVKSADGTASQQIDVTITGTNDTASITGTATGAVKEDGTLTAAGTLTVADVDSGEAHFQTPASLTATYGVFTFDPSTGVWGYTLNNAAANVQSLAGGQVVHDTLTVKSADGTASQQIDVTITGTNDAAVITGKSSGTVVEAGGVNNGTPGTPTATGTLTDTDVDNAANTFTAVSIATASDHGYGTFKMTAAGVWTYTLDNTKAAVQALNVGSTPLTNSFTVTTIDGTAQTVTVTINGTNDAAVISGTSSGNVEIPDDGPGSGKVTDTGTLTDTDVDNTPNTFIAAAAGSATDHGYGTYQMTAAGVWTYTLNYSNPTVHGLDEGQHLTDTFTVHTVDGTAKVVTVTISDDDPRTGPAGVAGSEINLGLAAVPPDPGSLVTVTVADLPSGWSLTGGVQVDDHTWAIQTSDVQSLTVIPSSASLGAVVLEVSESWTKPDGGLASALVVDNVESYAVGSPIFALTANDFLTGSSGSNLFVFAQPISHDVIYSFDAASDKIDLVGFSGFADFNDVAAHLSDDGVGNTVLTLASDETITLHGVNSASLGAGNFEFNQQTVLENSADMIIGNGAKLPLSGLIENTGVIELNSTGGETDLQLIQNGATLHGGGQIVLADSDANVISGTSSSVTLNNEDNTISGAGQLGNGNLAMTNAGTINATGTHVLNIDTGSNIVLNSGVLEASGSGGMTVASAIANSGILWANGSTLTVQGAVSGNGTAKIDGAGAPSILRPPPQRMSCLVRGLRVR